MSRDDEDPASPAYAKVFPIVNDQFVAVVTPRQQSEVEPEPGACARIGVFPTCNTDLARPAMCITASVSPIATSRILGPGYIAVQSSPASVWP